MVPLGAEQHHAALEEAELHAELDGQREVVERQRLEGREEIARAAGTAVLGRNREGAEAVLGELAQPFEHELAVLVVGQPVLMGESRIGQSLPDKVTDADFRAVEERLEGGDVDRGRGADGCWRGPQGASGFGHDQKNSIPRG